jgi:hypothetical protein
MSRAWSTPGDDLWHREAARQGRRIVDPPYDAASKTDHGPSNDAGDAIRAKTPTLRERVLIVLERGNFTADEIAERMGKTIMAVRPRVTELSAAGEIEDTKLRRANASGVNATVWRIKKKQEA